MSAIFTMVGNTSSPKIFEPLVLLILFLHNKIELMQHLVAGACQHVFEEDCCLNHPHSPIIDGDIRWDSGWFWVVFWVVLGVTQDVPS